MIIEIKGNLYNNMDFRINGGMAELRFPSEKTFAEIVADFALNEGDSIIQRNDSEEQVGVFCVEKMGSIQLPGEDASDVVTIKYHISQLGKEAQEAITEDLDIATLSVLELAGIVSRAKKSFDDAAKRVEEGLTEHNNRLVAIRETVDGHTNTISQWENMYNRLADRVAQLENAQ